MILKEVYNQEFLQNLAETISKIDKDFNSNDKVIEIDFREIHKYHEEKKKQKNLHNFNYLEFFSLTKFTCFCRKKYKIKRNIVQRAIEISNSYMDIIFIIKEFMQLNSVKRVLLSDPQLNLLKYQNKYLNFENPNETNKFLKFLENNNKMNGEMYDKEENKDVDLKMCDGLINYYNF